MKRHAVTVVTRGSRLNQLLINFSDLFLTSTSIALRRLNSQTRLRLLLTSYFVHSHDFILVLSFRVMPQFSFFPVGRQAFQLRFYLVLLVRLSTAYADFIS
jgi:hypothetical protein